MKFTCSSGQRPLDGYTLKRGIGCGGFGEVYYALSDGGKEVALKLVKGNSDVELRGIAQCLNLKHPNLVALYDIKTDNHGDHWVLMEYIAGEPLNVVLNRHAAGLPPELAQQWFLALARAVGYLHDHGIVHRDLKPGNIFLENGILKIGDYGLSKFISSSQRTAQTQSVGTVYYMAPEISTGNYNKQIDIYASGIILYEMLTGRVPFEGESAGEILMKHLTSPPDLAKLPAEWIPIVAKALAKNPAQRYQTIGEMAKAVEAVGQTRARQAPVCDAVPIPERAPKPQPQPSVPYQLGRQIGKMREEPILDALPVIPVTTRIAELCGSMALAAFLALLLAMLYAAFGNVRGWYEAGSIFFTTVAITWAVLIPAKLWEGRAGDAGGRRLIMLLMGLLVGSGALWLSGSLLSPELPLIAHAELLLSGRETWIFGPGFTGTPDQMKIMACFLSYFGLSMASLRWWKLADRRRTHRFSCFPVVVVGFWSLVLLMIWPSSEPAYGAIALITASVLVQWVSPWQAPPPPLARRMRLRYA